MTTTAWYQSRTFDETRALTTQLTDLQATSNTDNPASSAKSDGNSASLYDGHLASFIFLVAGLEKSLRDISPIMFSTGTSFTNTRLSLGAGYSFTVERAEWKSQSVVGLEASKESGWGKFVALKYVKRTEGSTKANWKAILLEIRALLHEPIRYHPNIVRLLGLTWAATEGTRSVFPVLALEYAEFGSLKHLQINSDPLPFKVKKKLCHDVAKGLSILHACGIVHADLKHENVLVFRNKDKTAEIIYTAKLADFGGSVMDLVDSNYHTLHMGTPPYNAPEAGNKLGAEELKLTDLYSLGLLIWRAALDGKSPFEFLDFTAIQLEELKLLDQLLTMAKDSIRAHATLVQDDDVKVLDFAFENTIQAVPQNRNLARTVAVLEATELSKVHSLLQAASNANEEEHIQDMARTPGKHGITRDGLGVHIAKTSYGDYDYQNAGPGHRPKLSTPDPAEFLFEPLRLKDILDWSLQQDIVRDLESSFKAAPGLSTTQIPQIKASFALFQCYVHEFGVTFDAERACYYLRMAAESDDECLENYLAQAWCWRIHRALNVTLDIEISKLRSWMCLSIMRGHRKCITDSLLVTSLLSDTDEKNRWKKELDMGTRALNILTGGVGMPYFMPHKLRRQYDITNMNVLDEQIQAEFSFRGVNSIDKIFVTNRGDGILHMAAAHGNLLAVKHLLGKYRADINLANQASYDTPLMYACRGGHLDCSLFLIDNGANPNGSQYADETPLHWLCAFTEEDIPAIAQKLFIAGASLKANRNYRLPLRRSVWSDPEYLFALPTSPLSRAVIMESLPAVKALLAIGADPLEGISEFASACPIVIAAILTMPRILEVMLLHIDANKEKVPRIFSDMEMLQVAVDKIATIVDTMTLESRLSRTGAEYKSALYETLELLHLRDIKTKQWETIGDKHSASAENTVLARMVSLGRVDIVDSLLRLGHSVNGKPDACPIVEAVKLNHEMIFRLLIGCGANIMHKVSASNGGQRSLLQISADRPSQSRPGLLIPKYLIKMGVPIDPLPDGSRSAFASAVINQDFALADLLLQHGADMNFFYAHKDGQPWITVFGELVQTPTEKGLESIKYLLGIDRQAAVVPSALSLPQIATTHEEPLLSIQNRSLPSFIVDEGNCFSVLHLAATHIPRSDSASLILGQMVTHILSEKTYQADEAINNCHPSIGTALWAATLRCNLEVVSALLEKGANPNIAFMGTTPLQIALLAGRANMNNMDATMKHEILKKFSIIAQQLRDAGGIVVE